MNWKRSLLLGITSAALAILACLVYGKLYNTAFYTDYSKILTIAGVVTLCTISCVLMALGYLLLIKWKGEKFLGIANILYNIISFASIVVVLSYKLPLEMEGPEMFPGFAIPMHFFPILSFLTLYPFFRNKSHKS